MDTILIIGGRSDTVRKAKELGLRVVLMQHQEYFSAVTADLADGILLVDYTDWSIAGPLARAAHQIWGFTHVVSLVDQAMETVGRINDELHLGGTPYSVSHLFRDKLAMRQHLADTGLEVVAATPAHTVEDLREFGERHGYPIVLKPIDGTASRGVLVVESPDLVDEAWRQGQQLRGSDDIEAAKYYPVDQFLVEEYIDGPEYAVESFSFNGEHIIVGITEKLSYGVVEIGHAEPARMEPDAQAALIAHITAFLTCMGLRDGVGCTEIKMSSKGPRIIESHDRAPGDRVMDLVEQAYGFDMELYAVGWPYGLVDRLTERPATRRATATRFLLARPGTVKAIEGVAEVRGHPGVFDVDVAISVGDEVRALTTNFDRIGQIITIATDTTAAVELCDALVEKINIQTEPQGSST